MRRAIPLSVALWSLAWMVAATAAQGGTLTVEFDLTGSTIDILGGGVVIPPEGSITTGSVQLIVQASDIQSPMLGLGSFDSLTFDVDVDGDILGNAITGSVAARQTGSAAGSLTKLPGGPWILSTGGSPVLEIDASIDCTGPNCASIGSFPISVADVYASLIWENVWVTGLATPGAAAFATAVPFSLAGFEGEIAVVGVEVDRSYIPEPTVAALLGMGLLAFGGLCGRLGRGRR